MFEYRALQPGDAETWRGLRLRGATEFPLGFLITPEEAIATSSEDAQRIILAGSLRGVFQDGNLLGFCGYRPQRLARTSHRGEIGPFFISREWQGTGAAMCLLDGVVAEARAGGIEQLELTVSPGNHRAIAFYEREGFERFGIFPDAVRMGGVPADEYLYRRLLR